jgi:HEAT repeat protein
MFGSEQKPWRQERRCVRKTAFQGVFQRFSAFATVCLLLQPLLAGQGPGDQAERYFPLTRVVPTNEESARELRNALRLLRKGSSTDRLDQRGKLMENLDRLLGPMLDALGTGNHFPQRQICLVLMQARDSRAVPALRALAAGRLKGPRGVAGLALGKYGDPALLETLADMVAAAQKEDRLMAILALGRLGDPRAVPMLGARLRSNPTGLEREALLLALGLTASAESWELIQPSMRGQTKDKAREAAVLAAGYLDSSVVAEALIERLKDEEQEIRRAALTALSRMPPQRDLFVRLMALRPEQVSSVDEDAAWVMALAGSGGDEAVEALASFAVDTHRSRVRAAVAGSCLLIKGPRSARLALNLLGDEDDDVVLAALLATIGHARQNLEMPALSLYANHGNEQVREVALLGEVYLRGVDAASTLRKYQQPELKDDVRKLAKELLQAIEEVPHSVRDLAWVRLQIVVDRNGWSPSWNLNRAVNEHLYRILGLENALDRRGSGQAPGAVGGGADRGVGAVASAPSPEEEDLRRHLDRYPYIDRRDAFEMPRPSRD